MSARPATAHDSKVPETSAEVDPDARIDQYNKHMAAGQFSDAIADLEPINLADDNREGRAVVSAMRASALFGLKRGREAGKLVARAEGLAPQSSSVPTILFVGGLLAQRPDVSADAIDKMLARFPDAVREIDRDSMRFFLRNEPKDQVRRNDDRRIELARIGYGGELEGDYIAGRAVDILLDRGDVAGAGEFLKYIDEPELIENMLILKRYAALWPRLADLAGPHLARTFGSNVASLERAYSEKGSDHEILQRYVNALRNVGGLDEAIALRSRLPQTSDAMAGADEQMGWVVNNVASALHHAGQIDEGDRLLEMLNHAQMKDAWWRVSMIINRLEMLVLAGRFDKAATLIAETEASAKTDGNEYAQQLVRRLKYCTLSRLGRKTEAAAARQPMLDHANDALEPTISGLLCGGDADTAEQLALRALHDSTADRDKRLHFEEQFVRALQVVPLPSDDPSVWENAWYELRKRPAITKEYERLGRDMPRELLPPRPSNPAVK